MTSGHASSESPAEPEAKANIAGENNESAEWQLLGYCKQNLLLMSPSCRAEKLFVARNLGNCTPVRQPKAIVSAFNLIADSQFSEDDLFWKTDQREIDAVTLTPVEVGYSPLAPAVGRALRIDTVSGNREKMRSCRLIYHDPVWGKHIPVRSGTPFSFGLKLQTAPNRACVFVRFLDYDGEEAGIAECRPALQSGNSDTGDAIYTYSSIAKVPERAVTASIVVRAEISGDADNIMHIAEPVLRMNSNADPLVWLPDSNDRIALRRLWQEGGYRVYQVPYSGDASRLTSNFLEIWADGDETSVTQIKIRNHKPKGMIRIRPQEGDTTPVRVRNYAGTISFKVDGQELSSKYISLSAEGGIHRFTVPSELCNDEFHLIQLVDRDTMSVVVQDYRFLASYSTPWHTINKHCAPPLPSHLSPKAGEWMRTMERQIAYFGSLEMRGEKDGWLLRNLLRIEQVLVNGIEENKDFFPLHFPEYSKPKVSVIVPVHNGYHITFQCLCSLILARDETEFEIVVVDDGSTDQTSEQLAQHTGIKVVSRKSAGGYGEACHAGAAEAQGEYLHFLNNDTEVTAGWLDELVKVFEIFPKAGAAASKLFFPDGRLQDAGGLIFGNGAPANYGRLQNPMDPRFCYSRDADYVSGAALITPRAVWDEIGGFAEELRPAYFEDSWYSFDVRELGLRTIYCALSKVYHVEGASNGIDVNAETGLKRFQKINHPKFKRRWASVYEKHGDPGKNRDQQKDRTAQMRVLMLGWSTPTPDQDAGSYGTVEEIRLLQRLGGKITFAPINGKYMGRYTEELQRMGVECVHQPFFNSIEELLQARGREFDAIWVCHYSFLEPLISKIRQYAPKAKLMLNLMDLHFLREMRAAQFSGDTEVEDLALKVRERELATIAQSDITLSYSDVEIGELRKILGSDIALGQLPWIQPVFDGQPAFSERRNLCFLGSSAHLPNPEAANHFAASTLPLIWAAGVATEFHVYGTRWDRLNDIEENVVVRGYAPDLPKMFAQYRAFVAPLQSGAGIKGKVLCAMANGLPTVLSPIAAESIDAVHGRHWLIAESDEEWVEAIASLEHDEELWNRISEGGKAFVAEHYSADEGIRKMRKVLEQINISVRSDRHGS